MKRRAGFTLLELVVVVTLTGVVALLVYGAARAAADTRARLEVQQLAVSSELAWSVLVTDALRNVRASQDFGRPTLILEPGSDALGRPRDRLRLITAGGTPPLTGDADWEVVIEPQAAGLTLIARPIGVAVPARPLARLPGVTGLDARVLTGLVELEWAEEWSQPFFLPRAVEITLWTDSGPLPPPAVVTLG
ncbi:MAG: prepilin-type N-terminal cleavage/methylation domain-containing protein [Gemmatimonadota bacterium]|nr:MAG: prepilin-type N-terminal cleavage/methylation domain-containing protein [Gemmatimonadota bacterium]